MEKQKKALAVELEKAHIEILNIETDKVGVTVEFVCPESASAFLNIVGATFDSTPGSLYQRIARSDFDNDEYDEDMDWEYWCRPVDCNLEQREDRTYFRFRTDPAEFFFSVCISFPISDLSDVIMRLNSFNCRAKGAPILVPSGTYWKQ